MFQFKRTFLALLACSLLVQLPAQAMWSRLARFAPSFAGMRAVQRVAAHNATHMLPAQQHYAHQHNHSSFGSPIFNAHGHNDYSYQDNAQQNSWWNSARLKLLSAASALGGLGYFLYKKNSKQSDVIDFCTLRPTTYEEIDEIFKKIEPIHFDEKIRLLALTAFPGTAATITFPPSDDDLGVRVKDAFIKQIDSIHDDILYYLFNKQYMQWIIIQYCSATDKQVIAATMRKKMGITTMDLLQQRMKALSSKKPWEEHTLAQYRLFLCFVDQLPLLSPTETHLVYEPLIELHGLPQTDAQMQITRKVIEREREERKKGRYTLLHGQAWGAHCLVDLYNRLYALQHGPINQDDDHPYQFLRFRDDSMIGNATDKYMSWHVTSVGIKLYYSLNLFLDFPEYLMFTAGSFFIHNPGANPARYTWRDKGAHCSPLPVERVFTALNMQNIFNTYKSEIDELVAMHNDASENGNVVLFSFTPEMLQKAVYVAAPGGAHHKAFIVQENGFKFEANPQKVLDDLYVTDPQQNLNHHDLEFVIKMTKADGTLIPNNGMDVYSIHGADPKKYAAYERKRDALMAKIKQDLQATPT